MEISLENLYVDTGAYLCFLSGWDEITLVHEILASKISDAYVSGSFFGLDF